MKKILILVGSLIMLFGLVNCIGCGDKKPDRYAVINSVGGYGMRYHVTFYVPSPLQSHSSPCAKYELIDVHMYLDDYGDHKGTDIIWKNFENDDFPFEEHGQDKKDIRVSFRSNLIKIGGLNNPYSHFNGEYPVK